MVRILHSAARGRILAGAMGASLLMLSACDSADETTAEATEEAVEEVEATDGAMEPMASEEETAMEICDENGNRYPNEEAAKEAGLEEAQYGATYCEYIEE
ncbi:hypothetical protein [Sphingomicrobium clamense]|uniref:Lipoprotein n=1 Tax=Sphingomicrobium clamense TaxID=2851013 RepID=A0ABS6V396_9SPHN|nr:hypothetical protein [Sphingomicrobium sp. B8]MBW0144019.1 hypothetical protein [Sphingomicrobium sp. B8]